MSKNSSNFHVIPFEKGFVRGYYERRNGKLVWVSPYENSKDKQSKDSASEVGETPMSAASKLPKFEPNSGKNPIKPVQVADHDETSFSFLLEVIIRMVKQIDSFEPGEIVKLKAALSAAKSIVRELGYYDETIAPSFVVPNAKQSKLGSKAARETSAMSKELKRVMRRVTKSTLRAKVQKMSGLLQEAL